jgi:hypothetical protein
MSVPGDAAGKSTAFRGHSLAERPAVAHARRAYADAVDSEPQVLGWSTRWWIGVGRPKDLSECTDDQLYDFAVEIRAEVNRLRAARPVPEFRPDTRTVQEIREAEERARKRERLQAITEEQARDRLQRCLDDAHHAALLRWIELGGRAKDMPPLSWAPVPTDEVFEGVAR